MAGGGHSEKLLTLQWFVLRANGVDFKQALPPCNSLQSHQIPCVMRFSLESKHKPILPSTGGRSLLLCSTNHPGHVPCHSQSELNYRPGNDKAELKACVTKMLYQ